VGVAADVAGALGVAVPEVAEAVALVSIRSLEEVKRMVEAAQAVLTASVVDSRTTRREAVGRSVRGVPAEVRRDVALFRGLNTPTAKAVVEVSVDAPSQAPGLFRRWVDGEVGEEKLVSFFKSTDLLSEDGRREADGEVAEVAGQVGVRDFRERVNRVVARLEPEQAAERVRQAHERRHVSLRPTGEGMANLTGLLPGVAGQGVEAILSAYAKSRKAAGDERTEAQVKADALTGIVIGWAQATGRAPKGFTSTYRIRPAGATKPTDIQDASNDEDGPVAEPESVPSAESALDTGAGAGRDGQSPSDRDLSGGDAAPPDRSDADADGGNAVDDVGDGALLGLGEVEAAREAFARFLNDPARNPGSGLGSGGPGSDLASDVSGDVGGGPGSGGSVLPPGVGVQVNLVITDVSLFGFSDTPADLFGVGVVPAPIAREMVKDGHGRGVATLKRLYTDPVSGALVAMESKSRVFSDGLAQMIGVRDQFCRFPFCDTRIKHLDHIHPHSRGGATSFGNAQGLCAHHNLIKEADGAVTYPRDEEQGAGAGDAAEVGSAMVDAFRPGGGDIVTRLACGEEFTSPARWVPHETAATLGWQVNGPDGATGSSPVVPGTVYLVPEGGVDDRGVDDREADDHDEADSDFWDRPVPVDPQPELAEFYTDEYMNKLCDEYENEAA
jgi:hypothetical protein